MSTSLSFQSTQFDVIDHNGQPWIQARQLGKALGYARPDAVLKIYERNKDEFSLGMSTTVILTVGSTPVETRIFSLRGCHLIAMFARTKVAKAFRVWVLDVLDSLNNPPQPLLDRLSHKDDPERKELTAMINAWVGVAPIHYAGARAVVNAHIGVKTVDDMTVSQVKQAIQLVQGKIYEASQQALPQPQATSDNVWATLVPLFKEMSEATGQAEELAYKIFREMDKLTEGIPLHPQRFDSLPHPWVLYLREAMVYSFNTLESATKSLKKDILTLEGVAKHYWRTGNRIN